MNRLQEDYLEAKERRAQRGWESLRKFLGKSVIRAVLFKYRIQSTWVAIYVEHRDENVWKA